MKNKFIYLGLLAAGFVVSCQPEFDNDVTDGSYSAGEANFSTYVAVGNSLTSGYMDGTVSRVGQGYSFPNILAGQFRLVGGGEFTQPSYADDVNNRGGLLLGGIQVGATRLIIDASAGGPEPLAGLPTIEVSNLQAKAYNNMGVPGAKSFHLLVPGYGNLAGVANGTANPYFVRHATSPTTTVLADALSKSPTFFTNWIGNNDVLAYATSGGTGVDQTGNPDFTSYGPNDITDPTAFAGVYTAITAQLTANGAKGVVATIPDVVSIPFFTTVPYNPITAALLASAGDPTGAGTVQALNTNLYGPLKQIFTAIGVGDRINLLSATQPNPLLIKDETLENKGAQIAAVAATIPQLAPLAAYLGATYGQARQATSNDLVLLTTRTVIGTTPAGLPGAVPDDLKKFGITYPLQDQHILIASEKQAVADATAAYNAAIKSIAASKNLAVADMNAILAQLSSGLKVEDGQIYTSDYFSVASASTVLFSLDGVHPNARGYAVIANEVIKVINSFYKAHLPLVSAGNYPGATILPSN